MKATHYLFLLALTFTGACNKCYECTSPTLSSTGNSPITTCKGDMYYDEAKKGNDTFLGQGTVCHAK